LYYIGADYLFPDNKVALAVNNEHHLLCWLEDYLLDDVKAMAKLRAPRLRGWFVIPLLFVPVLVLDLA